MRVDPGFGRGKGVLGILGILGEETVWGWEPGVESRPERSKQELERPVCYSLLYGHSVLSTLCFEGD